MHIKKGTSIKIKLGDTLVEVMFAIGIFSLVAISAIAIMSSGTSNAQTALERTMTRNEIDIQAEALRFIQSSYIAERGTAGGSQYYTELWQTIKSLANSATNDVVQYNPQTCAELYHDNGAVFKQKAFIINPKKLINKIKKEALLTAKKTDDKFRETILYPRLLFGTDNKSLLDAGQSENISSVEGLYIVAVRDPGSAIVKSGDVIEGTAYFDFYIRSCWYGPGADIPTAISTMVRLYDPAEIKPL